MCKNIKHHKFWKPIYGFTVYGLFFLSLLFSSCASLQDPPLEEGIMNYQRYYQLDSLSGQFQEKWIKTDQVTLWSWMVEPEEYSATVVVLHGYLDHSALSLDLYKFLNLHHCRIVAMDLPGHGKSSGERAGLDDFSLYRKSIHALIASWDIPYEDTVFIGHSTGAAIIIDQLIEGKSIRGAVLAAPLVQFRFWDSVSTVLKLIKEPDWVLPVSKRPSSSNREFNRRKNRDPMKIDRFPLNWPLSIIEWQQNLPKEGNLSPVPLLVLQGEKDQVVFWERNIPQLENWFPHIQVINYPRLRHHLFNETEREQVFEDMLGFIQSLNE